MQEFDRFANARDAQGVAIHLIENTHQVAARLQIAMIQPSLRKEDPSGEFLRPHWPAGHARVSGEVIANNQGDWGVALGETLYKRTPEWKIWTTAFPVKALRAKPLAI